MRKIQVVLILVAAFSTIIVLNAVVQAAAHLPLPAQIASSQNRLAQDPGVTRIQTITLVSSPDATATALTTIWENYWTNYSTNNIFFPLPSDVSTVTVGGTYRLETNTFPITTSFGEVFTSRVFLTPTAGFTLSLSYHTESRAFRVGNQYRIVIHSTIPEGGLYQPSVVFEPPYEFVSYDADITDTLSSLGNPDTEPGRIGWTVNMTPGAKFDRNVVLGDSRLPVDLVITSFGVQELLTSTSGTFSTRITATVINSGTVKTGSFVVVELYDRPSGQGPPLDPNDHQWGVCSSEPLCPIADYRFEYSAFFAEIASGQTVPVEFNLEFDTPGTRELYLQVDSFGGILGQNLEPGGGENNNIESLGTIQAAVRTEHIYLPITLKQ